MTNGDLFRVIFRMYPTELWAMPEQEFLDWMNTEVSEPIIADKPTDDAVPVVRCRECKHGQKDMAKALSGYRWIWCGGKRKNPEGYCEKGERREEVD